jgi:hypothetical protein
MPTLTLDHATHTYWLDKKKFDSVTKILAYVGLSRNYDGISSFYAQRGTAVHKAVELVDKGTLDDATLDPRIAPYVRGYRKFVRESGYKPDSWEVPLYHDGLGFAGTIDKVGTLSGRFGILDIKTSRSLDPAVEPQLCAYTVLWNEHYPERPAEFKYALQLKDDGGYSLATKYSERSVDLWLSIMDVYRWKQRNVAG